VFACQSDPSLTFSGFGLRARTLRRLLGCEVLAWMDTDGRSHRQGQRHILNSWPFPWSFRIHFLLMILEVFVRTLCVSRVHTHHGSQLQSVEVVDGANLDCRWHIRLQQQYVKDMRIFIEDGRLHDTLDFRFDG